MEKHIGCIPIGEDDRLIGMVTDRDIVCNGPYEQQSAMLGPDAMGCDVMTESASIVAVFRVMMTLAKAGCTAHGEAGSSAGLPVINKSKRMVGIISLGDVSHSASGDLLSECVKSVSAHH